MFSVPTDVSTDWLEVVLLPCIALFFGLVIYFVGEFNVGEAGKPKPWRWVGVAILFLGALLGFRYFLAMVSGSIEGVAYRGLIQGYGRKLMLAHWFAFLGPFVSFLAAFLISKLHGKRLSQAQYDL